MDVSLHANLSDLDQQALKEYLKTALRNDQLAARWPLEAIAVYVDGRAYVTRANTFWQITDPYVYVGRNYLNGFPKGKALALLICFAQLLPEDAEVNTWISNALSKYLIAEFNQLRKGLIVAEVPAKGLAFTKDNQVAALLDDTWYLGNGVGVDVSGDEWTRCTL